MNKIRVAHIITRLDWGGSSDIFRVLTGGLRKEQCDVTLIYGNTSHATSRTSRFLRDFAGRTIFIPELKRDINILDDITAFIKLFHIIKTGHFDIVHTHTAKAGALGRLAAKLAGVRVIAHTPHGHNLYGYFSPRAVRWIIRIERFLSVFTDKVIALTDLEKYDYIKNRMASQDMVSVIRQGFDIDRDEHDWKEKSDLKRSFNIDPDEYVVGMAARLEEVKGPDIFVEAASLIHEQIGNTMFIISGEGSLRRALEERVDQLKMRNRVIFTGWRDDISLLFSIFDVVVLPSRNEAVGMVLLEAAAQGVASVASNVGGVAEIVEDGRTGILVKSGDVKAFASAVIALLKDKNKRVAMGRYAKERMRGRFRPEDMVRDTMELYMELFTKKIMPR